MLNRDIVILILTATCCLSSNVLGDTKPPAVQNTSMSSNLHLCNAKIVPLSTIVDRAMDTILDPCELVNFTIDDLAFVRNTIFAKHGREFNDPKLKSYFERQSWYKADPKFSEDALAEVQHLNVKACEEIEELKAVKIPGSREEADHAVQGTGHPVFLTYKDFLQPLKENAKDLDEVDSRWKNIFKSKKYQLKFVRKNTYKPGTPKLVLLPQNAGVCLMYPIFDQHQEVRHCGSDIYTLEGRYIDSLPFCPTYVLKDNTQLFIRAENAGDCGTSDWNFRFYNIATKESLLFDCSGEEGNCVDFLLTWLPDVKKILFVASYRGREGKYNAPSRMEINLIDQNGNLATYGKIRYLPSADASFYRIQNLLAVNELYPNSRWMLRFGNKEKNQYFLLSAFLSGDEKSPAVLVISNPPGKAVTLEEMQRLLSPEEEKTLSSVIISSELSGGNPTIDGREILTVPAVVYFEPGIHKISLKRKGLFDIKVDIDFKPGQKLDLYKKYIKPLVSNKLRD